MDVADDAYYLAPGRVAPDADAFAERGARLLPVLTREVLRHDDHVRLVVNVVPRDPVFPRTPGVAMVK